MNKMVEETVKNMSQQGERTGKDYIGEDGLLYCVDNARTEGGLFRSGENWSFGNKNIRVMRPGKEKRGGTIPGTAAP